MLVLFETTKNFQEQKAWRGDIVLQIGCRTGGLVGYYCDQWEPSRYAEEWTLKINSNYILL